MIQNIQNYPSSRDQDGTISHRSCFNWITTEQKAVKMSFGVHPRGWGGSWLIGGSIGGPLVRSNGRYVGGFIMGLLVGFMIGLVGVSLGTVWPELIWIKAKKSWLLLPQHQSTYQRGPESVSIEIPPFRPHFIKVQKKFFLD